MAKKSQAQNVETVNPEHEKLIEVLKFTPRTYKIYMWGYGGETVMGTVDRKIYDYFRARRLDLSDFAWDSDYAEENNIPEEMWPFPPGSWYECDSMGHAHGVARNAGTLQIDDEEGNTILQTSFDDFNYDEGEPEWCCNDEVWIGSQPNGTVVFLGRSNEKGTFFEGEIPLTQPFDITKLELQYDEIDNEEIINVVRYDGEDVDNYGGNTDGKSSDFGMYIAGSNEDNNGKWEKYTTMDDIDYQMTEWFPKKIKPVRNGVYMVKTAGKNSYTYQCEWNGEFWHSTYDATTEVKIKEWQGIAYNPDEQDLRDELDTLLAPEQTGWPFAGPSEAVSDPINAAVFTVKTLEKKSVTEQEIWTKDGHEIRRITGFRWGTWTVTTNDGQVPKFESGDVDMNSCCFNNIEECELDSMDDGCYSDVEYPEGMSDEEKERLDILWDEEGYDGWESDGWYNGDTEAWASGPLEITAEDGTVTIINGYE